MTCNCGDNEYNIEINNNGSCEPTTPIYNIALDNVGIDGFSPLVNFVNQTDESFNIAIEDVVGIHTSPAVPLYDWVNNNLNDIRYQLSNLDLSDYLKNDGTNAADTLNLNRLRLITNNNSKQSVMTNDGTQLRVSGQGITIDGNATSGQAYPHNITIAALGSSITIGNSHYKNIVLDNTSARYNGYEIATTNDIGNGTITITQGGVSKGTFTVNQSGNSTIDLDSATISNPITINATSGYNGSAVLFAPGAYSFDTSAGTRLESIWTDTVESVQHRYTHGLYINNGGRYYEYPKIEYIKEDYIPSEGSSTSSSTTLGFINTSLYSTIPGITAPIYITRVGAGYKINLDYDNDTLKVNQNGKLYADVQGGTSYTAGNGIDITNDTISVDESDLDFLKNEGTNTGSLVIGGTEYQSPPYVTAIGIGSDAGYTSGTALGNNTKIYGYGGIAIGASVTDYGDDNIAIGGNCGTENDTVEGAIQLGNGTNTISNSLCVGGNYDTLTSTYDNWELLDRTTGKIPNDRINTMVGATTLTGGTAGLVPAPTTSDVGKFLKADGTWDTVGGGGGGSYTAGTGIDITNDTISVNSSVVLTSGNQTISGSKTFSSETHYTGIITFDSALLNPIIRGTSGSSYRNMIYRMGNDSAIIVGNSNDTIDLKGSSTRPTYNSNSIALSSDIPTVNNATITFTQGGITKGTITLNQSGNDTIALDAGGGGGGAIIDDTTPSSSTVYSSQKTQDLIDALEARIAALEDNINGGNA